LKKKTESALHVVLPTFNASRGGTTIVGNGGSHNSGSGGNHGGGGKGRNSKKKAPKESKE
jgi:hypothetical protein